MKNGLLSVEVALIDTTAGSTETRSDRMPTGFSAIGLELAS